jgi:alkanesulfonate monooxygenase SsuD/methylene tetrahydromethanopterin reductase-like flavin-dependent oxidoreductase (luciferase family)
MRHGLFIAPFDELADPHRMMDVALATEKAGWDGIFLWDHLNYVEPVEAILDPYVCLAGIASVTSRIQLGPMITPLIKRRLAVVARQVTTLDLLSKGRLIMGFGLGDDADIGERMSFDDFEDGRARGRALSEGLEVLADLLSGGKVDHDGEFYEVDGVTFQPTPQRPGGVPFWLAARWPYRAPLRRAAKYQGVVVIQMTSPEDIVQLREHLRDDGADMEKFEIVVWGGDIATTDVKAWEEAGVTWLLRSEGPFHLRYEEVLERVSLGP